MGESIAQAAVPAIFSGIFGADEPTYQQPSMSQIQTPVQQALNDILIKRATSAAGWAQKFEDDMPRRVAEWENQKTNYANQTPTTTVNKPAEVAPAVEEKPKETPSTVQSNPYMDNLYKMYSQKSPQGGNAIFGSGMNAPLSNAGQAITGAMEQAGLSPDALIQERTGLSKEQRQAMGVPDSYYMQMMPDLTNKVMDLYGSSQKENENQALLKKLQGVK
jgi:hypothetical protein